MKQEDKDLLLKDLCARLPYGFIIHRYSDNVDIKINTIDDFSHFLEYSNDEKFKPYLRPMSSMTGGEKNECYKFNLRVDENGWWLPESYLSKWYPIIEFFNAHHFDYHGLIEKGLALGAPEEMY